MGIFDIFKSDLDKKLDDQNKKNEQEPKDNSDLMKQALDKLVESDKLRDAKIDSGEMPNIDWTDPLEAWEASIEKKKEKGKSLIDKYGKELGEEIHFQGITGGAKVGDYDPWIDMTRQMLNEYWGKPEDEKKEVTKDKVKAKCYYGGRITQLGTTVYKYEVKMENDVVVGWKELE